MLHIISTCVSLALKMYHISYRHIHLDISIAYHHTWIETYACFKSSVLLPRREYLGESFPFYHVNAVLAVRGN